MSLDLNKHEERCCKVFCVWTLKRPDNRYKCVASSLISIFQEIFLHGTIKKKVQGHHHGTYPVTAKCTRRSGNKFPINWFLELCLVMLNWGNGPIFSPVRLTCVT